MKSIRGVGAVILATCILLTATAAQADQSLYARLGEGPGIRYLVDTFFFKVSEDGRINKRFKNANIPRLKKLVVQQLEAASGGPQKYTGKNMVEAHRGMAITNAEFSAFAEDFTWAMQKTAIGPNEQKQVMAKLAPMRSQVVQPPPAPVAAPAAKGKPAPKTPAKTK